MTLESLGWTSFLEESFAEFRPLGLEPARVAVEDKHGYLVVGHAGEVPAQVTGKLLHQACSAADLPKVGDWVALSVLAHEAKGMIHRVLPRRTKLSRKVPGRAVEEQVLAANIDLVFLVQSLDERFNPRLLERQLVMVYEGGAAPVVVLNKADLCDTIPAKLSEAQKAVGQTPIVVVSAKTGKDLSALDEFIGPGVTVVFIGPSGVGKSSLINRIYGEEIQATIEVRQSDGKGRHTTSSRELIMLPQGGIVIDTPGMREMQLWSEGAGVLGAFSDIESLAANCRFRDCTHSHEQQCAVKEAVAAGHLPSERHEHYLKLQREMAYLSEAHRSRAGLDRKRETKTAPRAFNKYNKTRER